MLFCIVLLKLKSNGVKRKRYRILYETIGISNVSPSQFSLLYSLRHLSVPLSSVSVSPHVVVINISLPKWLHGYGFNQHP